MAYHLLAASKSFAPFTSGFLVLCRGFLVFYYSQNYRGCSTHTNTNTTHIVHTTPEHGDEGLNMSGLLDAARDGYLSTVKRLLRRGKALVTEADSGGRQALSWACSQGHYTILQWLLVEGGAKINDKDQAGMTAVMWAAESGRFSVVQWLLEKGGANINEEDNYGNNVWSLLELDKGYDVEVWLERIVEAELNSLLKVMVLLDDAPSEFIVRLSPSNAELTTRGRHLRSHLTSYLVQQRTSVRLHCPLIAVLQPLVLAYAVPTQEDMWNDWAEWM